MADLIPVGIGVDTGAIAAAANKGAYGATILGLYLIILLGLCALIFVILYKKSFNIRITILDNTKGGIVFRDDLRGKLRQVRPGEFKFTIWKGKQLNLRYNQETFSNEDLYYDVKSNGKLTRRLLMSFDSEGQLIPLRVNAIKSKIPLKEKDGSPVLHDGIPVYVDSTELRAEVKQVDTAWYYKELDKSAEVFDARSFWDKHGFVIIIICLILTLLCFGYVAYKFVQAADQMGRVVAAQGEIIKWLELSRSMNNTVTSTGGGFALPGVG